MDFLELSDYYNSYNYHSSCFNGGLGEIYNLRNDNVNPISCHHWDCPKCRPNNKYKLFLETYYLVENLDFNKHFTITFQGKKIREKHSFEQSYPIMSKIWNKYKQVIEYHKGKFDYIIFPRAQKNGYCHFHVILPKFISWKFLDEKRKLYPELGYVRINKNVDLAQYLHQDFFKDHEYYIPKGIRHYSTSRALKFNKFSNPFFQEDNAIIMGNHTMQEFEDLVKEKFGRPLPNEHYLKEFIKGKKNDFLIGGNYLNGELKKPILKGGGYTGNRENKISNMVN